MMKLKRFGLVAALSIGFLTGVQQLSAQEIIIPQANNFQFGAQPGSGQPYYSGDVGYNSATGEYQITAATPRSTVARAFMYPKFSFCAEDYLITYEALINGATPTSGEVRVGAFYDKSGAKDAQTIVELDTYQDGGPTMPYGQHEINNNHMAVETQLGTVNGGFDGKAGWDTFTATVQAPPFLIAGTDQAWVKVQIRNNKGDVTADAVKGSQYLKLFAKSEYRPNTPLYLSVEGSTRPSNTGYSTPQQKIRNIQIHILKSCSNNQTPTDVLNGLDPTHELDSCPVNDQVVTGISDGLSKLKSDSAINQSLYEDVLNLISNKLNFCNGSSECKADLSTQLAAEYQKGFQAGVSSIDQEAIKKVAFASGVSSVDVASIRTTAFNDGVASVPVDTIKSQAYQEGFEAGKGSIQCPVPVDGGGSDKEGNKKVTICHKASNTKSNTIEVSKNALPAHLKHGDTEGACRVEKTKETKSKK